MLPYFHSKPPLVVGTPDCLAKTLPTEIPKSLFQENENPNLLMQLKFIQQYLIQTEGEVVRLNQ